MVKRVAGFSVRRRSLQGEHEDDDQDQRDRTGHEEALEVAGKEVHDEAAGEDADGRGDADDARDLAAARDRHLIGQRGVGCGEHRVHRRLHEAPGQHHDEHGGGHPDDREPAEADDRPAEDPGATHAPLRGGAVGETPDEGVRDERESSTDTHHESEAALGVHRIEALDLERHRHHHGREKRQVDAEIHGGESGGVSAGRLQRRGAWDFEAGGTDGGRGGGR